MTQQPKKQQRVSPLVAPKTRMGPQQRKPLGPGLTWSDKALDSLSGVTEADIEPGKALWRDIVSKHKKVRELTNLLDAKVKPE